MLGKVLILALCVSAAFANPCAPRDFNNGGVVCVCNATYCDSSPRPIVPERGQFLQYTSSRDGLRLHQSMNSFDNGSSKSIILKLNAKVTFQTINGFGAAFTDATGINIKSLSSGAQDNLMKSYFSEDGSSYNLGRVPIAGCDFSTSKYTYDDVPGDIELKHFNLTEADYVFKIPLMQKALQMNPAMRFLAAAWTAPPWMKSNNDYVGIGFLQDKYYQIYTNYLMRFLDSYKLHGLEMWALSTGNEPTNGVIPVVRFNSMGWTPSTVAKWIAENLGPTLRSSKHNKTLILALDDQRFDLPWYINDVFRNEAAKNYTDGVAVHWYWDGLIPATVLDRTHNNNPEKFLLMTEASIGDKPWDITKVVLGSWKRGESYITNIIENLNHWMTGWVDWNLALNQQGGPNWNENYVDAAIIVNSSADEFYKQPTFYAVAHFSKFIPPGSVRIQITDDTYVKSVAFRTPKNETALVLYNKRGYPRDVTVHDPDRGNINLQLPKNSVHTIIYK